VTAVFVALVVGLGLALWQAGVARAAEARTRASLAQSRADAGRLAAQRGNWREAMTNYRAAVDLGHADVLGLRLGIVRALQGLGQPDKAIEELKRIEVDSQGIADKPQVLFWEGELYWTREPDRAVKSFRQALAMGLTGSDETYARALIADKPTEAAALLRETLHRDPMHLGARQALCITLLPLCQLDEAERVAENWADLYPDDPMAKVAQAICARLRGDEARSESLLANAEQQLGEQSRSMARFIIKLTDLVRSAGSGIESDGKSPAFVSIMTEAMAAVGSAPVGTADLPIPRCFNRAGRNALQFPLRAMLGKNAYLPLLEELADDLPIGFFFLQVGLTHFNSTEWQLAEPPLRRATTAPGQESTRNYAHLLLALNMSQTRPSLNRDAKAIADVRMHVEAALNSEVADDPLLLKQLSGYCIINDMPDLSWRAAEQCRRRFPTSSLGWFATCNYQYIVGNYPAALWWMNDGLERFPNDPQLTQCRTNVLSYRNRQYPLECTYSMEEYLRRAGEGLGASTLPATGPAAE
jgi:tetratricopeptide (TPR) repeat protein